MKRFTAVEARIDAAAHEVLDRLPAHGLYGALVEFLVFGLKQAWACLFGAAMLALIIATRLFWPDDAGFPRYDFLFLAALTIQLAMLGLKLEDAAAMASTHPADFLGYGHELGRIAPGYRASLVLLDDALEVAETWIDGVAEGRL